MSKLAAMFAVLAATLAPALHAQVPGAYPHLQLTDGVTTLVPPASGPFDNSNVFPAFAGQSFSAQLSYASAGQANTNVLWALLVSANKTPFSTTLTPPPLFTMPPFILVMPTPPNLDALGHAAENLFVPSGILNMQFYVQGLIYDSTSSPALRLSDGLTVDVSAPSYGVTFSSVKATPATDDETIVHDFGVTTIGPAVLPNLKPIGVQAPPAFSGSAVFYPDDVRFLPITHNTPDEPINPRARPFTRINAAASATDTTLIVQDTSFFPTRGRLLIAFANDNLWNDQTAGLPPRAEVVLYDGKLKDRFLNCQRAQLGTSGTNPNTTQFPHLVGEQVLGEWTFATTSGAQARQRLSLDCTNADMPHVVIPAFTVPATEGGTTNMDLDLYLFESKVDKIQGFVVFDRVTQTWRTLGGTLKNTIEGRWNPMICVAPDGKSFLAELVVPGGDFGWDNASNFITAVRTDGLDWPATGTESWPITHETGAALTPTSTDASARRAWMPATAIIGPDPDNYVAFIGLAYKFKLSNPPGQGNEKNVGFEADWVRQEVIVHDYIDLPLVPPGSSKGLPVMPRPFIDSAFGSTGFNDVIVRYDPEVLASADSKQLLLVGGGGNAADTEEDAFVIRNVGITATGGVAKVVGNITGFSDNGLNSGITAFRPFWAGGQGQGRHAAFSPSGTKVALVAKDGKTADWLQIAATNGSNYGHVKNVFDDGNGTYVGNSAYQTDRVIMGLRWADEGHVLFMMGKNPYNDVAAVSAGDSPSFDLHVYDIAANTITNLTNTAGTQVDHPTGRIKPAGYFASPGGQFAYFLRYGGISSNGGSSLPLNTQVMNVIGVNVSTLHVFPVTGDEFDASALVGNLDVSANALLPPVESPASMQFTEGSGVQAGMLYFTANKQGGNGSDEIFGVNLDQPFVTFQATNTTKPGRSISNVVADPYGGKLAFARTDGTDPAAATQHPFVIDLNNFLFERDLLPIWVSGGANLGRVMDGSFFFIAPTGSAGDALVFSFGLGALPDGIALLATPAYYPLAAVSDVLAQPIPVVIPLVDTFLLGTDFRFYLNFAGPAGP